MTNLRLGDDGGSAIGEFPGCFSFAAVRDANTSGMLSVNASTGAVWYRGWHGSSLAEKDRRQAAARSSMRIPRRDRPHAPTATGRFRRELSRCGDPWTPRLRTGLPRASTTVLRGRLPVGCKFVSSWQPADAPS
jgi:hypothetical protein